jgi:hypothetical protein
MYKESSSYSSSSSSSYYSSKPKGMYSNHAAVLNPSQP